MAKTGEKPMEDVTKLPKWAQHRLQVLQSNLESTQKHLRAALGEAPSRVQVDPYFSAYTENQHGPRAYLRNHETVRFIFSDQHYVDVSLRDYGVLVSGEASADELTIRPQSGNSFFVNFAARFKQSVDY